MSTNYYFHRDVCPHCERADKIHHIGKSSVGWCFSLHMDQDLEVTSLEDWKRVFAEPNSLIISEYGRQLSVKEMIDIITVRAFNHPTNTTFDYESNGAEPGPNGLVRSKLDDRCIGHGKGTWDLITGEFS